MHVKLNMDVEQNRGGAKTLAGSMLPKQTFKYSRLDNEKGMRLKNKIVKEEKINH